MGERYAENKVVIKYVGPHLLHGFIYPIAGYGPSGVEPWGRSFSDWARGRYVFSNQYDWKYAGRNLDRSVWRKKSSARRSICNRRNPSAIYVGFAAWRALDGSCAAWPLRRSIGAKCIYYGIARGFGPGSGPVHGSFRRSGGGCRHFGTRFCRHYESKCGAGLAIHSRFCSTPVGWWGGSTGQNS
ncbi:hypothetical protein D3C81_881090 [compost metagenome]